MPHLRRQAQILHDLTVTILCMERLTDDSPRVEFKERPASYHLHTERLLRFGQMLQDPAKDARLGRTVTSSCLMLLGLNAGCSIWFTCCQTRPLRAWMLSFPSDGSQRPVVLSVIPHGQLLVNQVQRVDRGAGQNISGGSKVCLRCVMANCGWQPSGKSARHLAKGLQVAPQEAVRRFGLHHPQYSLIDDCAPIVNIWSTMVLNEALELVPMS